MKILKESNEYSINLGRGKHYQFIQDYELAPITGGVDLNDSLCQDALNRGYLAFQKMGDGEWWIVIPNGVKFTINSWNMIPEFSGGLEICELENGYQIPVPLSMMEEEENVKITDFVREI
jgi:hypothetical protein